MPVPPEEALVIVKQILEALHFPIQAERYRLGRKRRGDHWRALRGGMEVGFHFEG